ncbi:MAG: tryptophan synthase subunit alpha [Halobacteriota archaeon]
MNAISATFQELRRKKEGALIGYVMAGDPTPKHTPKIVDALIAGGADIVELGIPFSDPIADGPTLQRAAVRALEAGTTPKKVFDIAGAIKSTHDVPMVVMTYYNIIYQMGIDAFCSACEKSGVNGIIVPDLPVEEAALYNDTATRYGLDTIFLAAPSTSEERLERLVKASSGFLYLVSANGVTGARETVQNESVALVKRTSSIIKERIPLAVGFGLSRPSHIQTVINNGANAAIVGSRFAQIVEQNLDNGEKMLNELRQCAQALKEGTLLSGTPNVKQ